MRQAQFFITTIVVSALAITLIALNLYIPKEVNLNEINRNLELVDNALFIKDTLKSLNQYFENNWLIPYTNRLIIKVDNNFKLSDSTISAEIKLPINAYTNSLKLTDADKNEIPFNVNWFNEPQRNGTIYFQANAKGFERPEYHLYFNTAPGSTIYDEAKKMVISSEDDNNFWVITGSYYALINKSAGGSIKVLNSSDTTNIINEANNYIKCGTNYYWLNQSINNEVTITDMDYYIKAEFTGSRFFNETYKVTELFFPDKIMIIDEMRMASDSPCSEWGFMGSVSRSVMPNYADSEGLIFEPTGVMPKTFTGNLKWVELYNDEYGVGYSGDKNYPVYIEGLTDQNRGEFRFINSVSTIARGEYKSVITLIPTQTARLSYTKSYYEPSITTKLQDFETEFNSLFGMLSNYFYDSNTVINYNKSTGLMTESFSNQDDWTNDYYKRTWLSVTKPDSMFPIEASLIVDANSNNLLIEGETIKPVQVNNEASSFDATTINSSLLVLSQNDNLEISLTGDANSYLTPLDLTDDNLYSSLIGYWKLNNNTLDETGINHGTLRGDTIGLWHFDEGSGITAYDSTAYNHNGTVYGATWTNGKSGSALSFNGIDNHVSITHDGSLNFNPLTEKYSISFWFSANYIPVGNTRTMIRDSLPLEYSKTSYWFDVREYDTTANKGQMLFGIYDSTHANDITSPTFISLNQWYHAVGVANTTHLTLYVNGSLIGTTPITIDNCENTENNLEIGLTENWDGIKYFDGKIDEIAVYNKSLTQEEVSELYNAQKAKFIEYIQGKHEEGIKFDGNNDLVTVPDSSALDLVNTPFTISLWVNRSGNSIQTSEQLIHKESGSGTYGGYNLWIDRSTQKVNFRIRNSANSYITITSTNAIAPGCNHILVSYNLTGLSLYINNNPTYLDSSLVIGATTAVISIGDVSGGGKGYAINGTIDEAMIYNRALSASEIEKLYTTSPHYTPPTSVSLDADSLIGYWNFNTESNKTIDYSYNNHGTLYGNTLALLHFDEGSGTYAKDETSYNNYGTISGATWTNGISGTALHFDGVNDLVSIPHSSSMKPPSTFTLNFWLYIDSFVTNYHHPVDKWVNAAPRDGFFVAYRGLEEHGVAANDVRKLLFLVYNNDVARQITLDTRLETGKWYMITASASATQNKLEVYDENGLIEVKTAAGLEASEEAGKTLDIGGHSTSYGNVNGLIDEVAVYNRSLTDSEVLELYNTGRAKFIEYVNGPENFGTGILFDNNTQVNTNNDFSWSNTESFSINTWFKTEQVTNGASIIGKAPDWEWELIQPWYKPKSLIFVYYNTGGYGGIHLATKDILTPGQWYNLVVVYNASASTAYMYINKNLVATSGVSGTLVNRPDKTYIGYSHQPSTTNLYHFNGTIDEVRVYNKSLSIEEVRALYTSAPYYERNPEELIGYWQLDGNAYDYAGNNDGTINGATFVTGKYGQALSFNGFLQDYMEIPTGNSLGINSDITLSAWIKQDGFAGIRPVIHRTVGTDTTYIMEVIEKKVRVGFLKDLYNHIVKETINDIEQGVWQLVTVTYTLGSMNPRIYINGVEAETTTISAAGYVDELVQGDAPVIIGTAYYNYFDGLIDEIRIYNKALNKNEVKELYEESPYQNNLVLNNADSVYKLTIGDINTTVKTNNNKIMGISPITLLDNGTVYLLVNESTTNLALSITTYSTNTQTFKLYDAWNKLINTFSRNSAGITSINTPVTPCINYCPYKLTVDNSSPYTISTNTKYISTEKRYMTNPLTPEVMITTVNNAPDNRLKVYYNGSSTNEYTTDLNYTGYKVSNSYYSFDLENMDFNYKGVEWFNGRGWNTCTNECTNEFSELKIIENGTERITIFANTSLGVEYQFYFYPQTPLFKVTVNSESNYSFGPSWAVNATNDINYKTNSLTNQLLGDNDKLIHKTNTTGPVSYITKSDELASASIIFDTNVLVSKNSIKVNDTAIIIRAYLPGTYWFIINEDPEDYLKKTTYNQYGTKIRYNFDSSRIKFTGEII